MPRQPRLDAPGALHHVIGRGINGVKIFDSRKDREDFIERLAGLCGAEALSVYAWAFFEQSFSSRKVGSKVISDERILGSSDFVKNVIADAEEKTKETLRLSLKISDLPSLAMEVCDGEGVDEAALRSGLRKREVVKSRRIFCQIAVKKMGYSGADVARFLGINTSAVNRLAVSDELPEIEKYT